LCKGKDHFSPLAAGFGLPEVREPIGVKVVGWQKTDGKFTARGFIIKQDESGADLTAFLESIDTIEAETGLDFFADLDDEVQEELERRLVRLCGVTSDRRPLASDVRRTEARLLDHPSIGKSLPRRR
jgi:hypothetical protein